MKALILGSIENGVRSAEKIVSEVRALGHKCVLVHEHNKTQLFNHDADVVLRYGAHFAFPLNKAKEVNSIASVIDNSDKSYSRFIMQENKLAVPKTWFDIREAEFPFIARPGVHSGGKEFRVVKNKSEIGFHEHLKNPYFSAIFPKVSEFRCHVWGDESFALFDKNIKPGTLIANQTQTHNKWTEIKSYEKSALYKKIRTKSIDACIVMGMKTGAVDIMASIDDKVAICEINTAPIINGQDLAKKYAEMIVKEAQ